MAEQAIDGSMKKGAFKLGLNELIDLFKPGSSDAAANHLLGNDEGSDGDDLEAKGRRAASMLRKPGRPTRQESEVYGRRW